VTENAQPRYAVYYAPPAEGGLWRLAQHWLGRDCETGEALEQPALDGWRAAEIAAATASPRHYGFHATLKAPFRLAPGVRLAALETALADFAARRRPFLTPPLKVSAIGSFIAVTLSAPTPQMQTLADDAVQEFDPLRAPLTEAEIARRLKAGLTPRQEELLRRWGYPYVEEEFRFHMTLTGALAAVKIGAERRERLQSQLAALFRPVLAEPVPVGEICLYSQADSDSPFRLARRFGFGAARAEGDPAQGQITA
jgi:putative phosphonate metabolism protein